MHLLKKVGIFFLIGWSSHIGAEIHVLMTSAMIDLDYQRRKEEYIKSFQAIKSYGIEPWIIESMPVVSSFFDALSTQVLYPQTNDPLFKNKGVNEALSIQACIPYLPFNDEDIVIKLTGRYWLYRKEFIDTIEANRDDFDAFVCLGKHFVSDDHVFTGCYALRWKYFKQMIDAMDFEKMEREWISVEQPVAEFIRDHHLRIKVVDPLYVEARIFLDGVSWTNYIRQW